MASKQENCAYFDNMEKIGSKHKHMFWIFSICYFFDMMDMNLFGSLGASVQATFSLTNEQISQLSSLSFYGMFFGGLLGGWMADKIGRKKALLYNVLIFSLASLGNAVFSNYYLFAFCRFMTGFGIIGMNIIAMVYIAEMMPAHSRGKYQGQMAALGSLGVPFGIVLAAAVVPRSPEAWRIMFLLGAFGLILFPIGLKWLYESPRWLVGQGRIEEADRVVETMSGMPSNLAANANAICVEDKVGMLETLKFLFGPKQIGSTIALAVMAIGCVVGGFYVANWTTVLLVQMGFDLQLILSFAMLGMVGAPLGDWISSKISDLGGRKTPITVMLFLAAAFCLINGLTVTLFKGAAVALAAYFITGLLRGACGTSATTMYWTYLAENLPNRYRSTGTGLIMSASRLLIGVVTPTVPVLFAMQGPIAGNGMFNVMSMNAVFYLVPAIICLLWGSKTAQKSLEEIEAEVSGK